MNDDYTLADLAALDALGILAGEQRGRYETLLAGADDSARQEAGLSREAVLLIAETLEPIEPPAGVKAAVLGAVRSAQSDVTVPAASRTVRADEGKWFDHPMPGATGVQVKKLSFDRERGLATILMRFDPGAVHPPHDHHGAEECFVLSGSCRIGDAHLRAGDFHHADAGSHHGAVISDEGCVLLLVVDKEDYLVA
ncbi:MAG TPA: cupin domain-containing protein [Thermoanaerobaculia bacterium]|nr:cupin domain-containing protein [Thermoanaerobaculia bacterium]